MQTSSIFQPPYTVEKCRYYVMSCLGADGSNNRSETFASFVVICEYESFVTQTVGLITARCVGTVLITSSVVIVTLVYICITFPYVHTGYATL